MGEETILNHFKPPLPFPASQFRENKIVGCLQLPRTPLGAVKINPVFPILTGNTDTNEDESLCGQRGGATTMEGPGKAAGKTP